MKIVSRLMAHFGYVRLKDYGYELSPSGRIVEVVKVEDDRFAPPPWQPVGWQSATSLLPPAPAKPPVPRPLAPAPDVEVAEAEPQPLFRVPGAPATVETAPPGPDADDDARELLRTMQKRAYELQLAAGDDVENEEYAVEPEKISAPVRLITGAHDFQFFADSATYLAERLPNVERIDLPWAGHLPTLERPSEALRLIL